MHRQGTTVVRGARRGLRRGVAGLCGGMDLGSMAALAVARARDGDDGTIRIRSGTRAMLYDVPREIEMELEIRVLMPHEIY